MNHEPDYVIVGAGSAGSVIAARLTEDADTTVILLEAGPDYRVAEAPPSIRSVSPMQVLTSSDNSAYRWDDLKSHRTNTQTPMTLMRGRGVGGSSSVNGMLAVRPEPGDLDAWQASGCAGWGWAEMLPWLNHIENDRDFGDADYHGDSGPFPVWRPPLDGWSDVDLATRVAMLDLGHPWAQDHNAPGSTGVSPYAANIDFSTNPAGERVSTNSAYLEGTRDRPNLEIVGDALVDRIVIEDGRAVGVTYIHEGVEKALGAANVLLCAGAPHSPATLLRSGVGPVEHLTSLDIAVTHDLPGVGEAVADHPGFGIQLLFEQGAIRTAPNGRHLCCFARWSSGMSGTGLNDMALIASCNPTPLRDGRITSQILVAVWQAYSQGTIRLRDPSPNIQPMVHEAMLSDPRDLLRMRDGFRHLVEIVSHHEVESLGGQRAYGRFSQPLDGPVADLAKLTDNEVDALLLEGVYDTQHIVGGNRMGSPDDPLAVVDPDCRVIGIDGLRVVDGSVFPTCPRANTHFITLALAERMAARLRS